MKNILSNGLLAGAVFIVVYLIFHFINPSLNYDFTSNIVVTSIIYLFFLIRAGFQQRKNLDGFLSFGEVFVSSIAIYAIASFIGILFPFIMILINPELLEIVQESSNQAMESTMRMMGVSEDQIILAIEEANEQQETNQMNLAVATLISWLISIIFPGTIYVLIASLITKKKGENIA